MQISFCGLNENIHIGRAALKGVREIYPRGFISNSRYETFSTHINTDIKSKLEDRIVLTRDITERKKRQGLDPYSAVAYAVQTTGTANCFEQAILVSDYMNKQGIANKIVSMSIYKKNSHYPSDGHNFCVIGMDKEANVCMPETWGKDAVVVDLWSHTVDKAQKALQYFSKIMQVNPKDNKVVFHSAFI